MSEKREVPGLPRRTADLLRKIEVAIEELRGVSYEGLAVGEVEPVVAELRRLALALTILGGQEHVVALDGRHSAYARGVLRGADPGDVAGAIARGEGELGC